MADHCHCRDPAGGARDFQSEAGFGVNSGREQEEHRGGRGTQGVGQGKGVRERVAPGLSSLATCLTGFFQVGYAYLGSKAHWS